MAILDARQDQYNKFTTFPLGPYNVVKYLMANEEEIWKILKYQDPDAWNKPNLTLAEKAGMIYAGQPNETDYRVFLDSGNDNSWTVEACMLRVTNLNLIPNNYVYGSVSVGFQVYSHYRINTMSNYTVRTDYVTQRLIETLNGAEIDGIGRLYFDFKASTLTKSVIIGAIPFKGRATVMCNYNLG